MQIEIWQIIALTTVAFLVTPEVFSFAILKNQPVMYGLVAGIIMGDIPTGLIVGGTLQLMILGISTFGGASIPDYTTGAIVGTVYAVLSGQGPEFGISLAVPVGLLMVQLDILARFTNVSLADRLQRHIKNDNRAGIERTVFSGAITYGLSRAIPICLMLIFGDSLIGLINTSVPEWIIQGLRVSGGLLPAVGIAILLRYLPVKDQLPYLLFGFGLSAYMQLPIMGISIFGLGAAILSFRQFSSMRTVATVESSGAQKGGVYYDGEYED